MKVSAGLFAVFVALAATELLGLGILSRMPAEDVRTNIGVASLWLTWMFGLWGALTLGVVFTIAWVAEAMSDQSTAGGAGLADVSAHQTATQVTLP